jgi:hypothetical protein
MHMMKATAVGGLKNILALTPRQQKVQVQQVVDQQQVQAAALQLEVT